MKAVNKIHVLLHTGNKQQQIITPRLPMLPAISATQEESVSVMASSRIGKLEETQFSATCSYYYYNKSKF